MTYHTPLEEVIAKGAEAEALVEQAGEIANQQIAEYTGNRSLKIWDYVDREQFVYEVAEHLANNGAKDADGLATLMIQEGMK